MGLFGEWGRTEARGLLRDPGDLRLGGHRPKIFGDFLSPWDPPDTYVLSKCMFCSLCFSRIIISTKLSQSICNCSHIKVLMLVQFIHFQI